ncbi:MAG: hypothetical protein ACYC3X_22355 [Pirellulaceae bacterium]
MDLIAFAPTFLLENRKLLHFIHNYNCYFPPFRMTERSLECALADLWLSMQAREEVLEVGAVTSYYWPYRVLRIVDPTDPHPLVTDKCSLFDISLRGKRVLCLSTLEHIGKTDFGLPEDPAAVLLALQKFFDECDHFLLTFPGGYNTTLDHWILQPNRALPSNVYGTSWVRTPESNDWSQIPLDHLNEKQLGYGKYWANCLIMLTRGNLADNLRLPAVS